MGLLEKHISDPIRILFVNDEYKRAEGIDITVRFTEKICGRYTNYEGWFNNYISSELPISQFVDKNLRFGTHNCLLARTNWVKYKGLTLKIPRMIPFRTYYVPDDVKPDDWKILQGKEKLFDTILFEDNKMKIFLLDEFSQNNTTTRSIANLVRGLEILQLKYQDSNYYYR
jgi:hypothetical protein